LPIVQRLRCRKLSGEPDPIAASAAKVILDEVWHREDDSDVRGAAVHVYDSLFSAFPETATEERLRQRNTLAEERQNELQERERRLQRREDIRVEVEDIIETMKHSCDEHDCVSKECY
ncbi:hypothetical protein AAVH_41857, partial [Aphelenchoides avenae]